MKYKDQMEEKFSKENSCIDRQRDYENRLHAGQVFDQMDEWPSDLEEFEYKLNSAVEGLLDHGPPKSELGRFDFHMNPEQKDPNSDLIDLMNEIDATIKSRKSRLNPSVMGQFLVIIVITFVSMWALKFVRNGQVI